MREELVWLDDESGRRASAWRASLEFVGALGLLLFASGRALLQGRIELRETVHQMAFIGAASAPIVALTSAFTGAVVTLYSASLLVQAGGGGFVGGAIALAMTRELAPILTGIMVTARCGSAIAAQLGTMKITEQIDALRALAVSPIQYLVIPRVLAALAMFPLLCMIANFSGVLGGYVVASTFGVGWNSFLQSIRLLTEPFDLIGGLIKTLAFALIVTLVSCQQGLGARGGAAGVGHATTRAVVLAMVLIFAANYFLADLLFAEQMNETPALETRQLVYAVEHKTILKGIDLRVEYGELLGVMGASGSGKTTLLKCLCGLVKPTSGEVWVEGVNIAPLSERERMPMRLRLGIVFQYAALFDYLTVEQNVAFGLERHRRLSKAQIRAIVRERLAWVGLEGIENLYPSQLSGGMRKRVGLARALAMDPHIVLFDEPTSGLDPVNAYQIDQLITRLNRELNLTAVVVSHDVTSLTRTCDRIVMVDDGQIIAEGAPARIRACEHPKVQAFLRMASAEAL